MAKPAGVATRNKDNSKKHAHVREEWTVAKKIGRLKQRWVEGFVEQTGQPYGYWEKTK